MDKYRATANNYSTRLNSEELQRVSRSENFFIRCDSENLKVFNYKDSNSILLVDENGTKIHGAQSEEIKNELSSLLENKHFL